MAKNESTKRKDSFKRGKKTGEAVSKREDFDNRARGNSRDFNDPTWYYPNDRIRDSYASLPLNVVGGVKDKVNTLNSSTQLLSTAATGIMTIRLHEGIGPANYMTDPINQTAFLLWSHVRSMMSGSSLPVDPADIMMYVLGVRSLYAWMSELIKVYGLLTQYTWENFYLPEALVTAEGFSYRDLMYHRPQFYAYLEESIAKVNRFIMPTTMGVFNRTVHMSEAVYFDSSTYRSQIYDFVWDNHYKYTYTDTGTTLVDVWADGRPTGMTFDDIQVYTEELINAMFTNEDVGTISGYMSKAFPKERLTLAMPTADYRTPLVYSEEMLMQIQNIKFWGKVLDSTIRQDPSIDKGLIKCSYAIGNDTPLNNDYLQGLANVVASGSSYFANAAAICSVLPDEFQFVFHRNDVTNDDWLVASRLSTALHRDSLGNLFIDAGTEYVVGIDIYARNTAGSIIATPWAGTNMAINMYNTTVLPTGMSAFRYAPELRVLYFSGALGSATFTLSNSTYMEADVNAFISGDDLRNLHRCALLGEFAIDSPFTSTLK
jgi:hypothetical protein